MKYNEICYILFARRVAYKFIKNKPGGKKMRRLWAHIAIAFACLFTAIAVFPNVLKNISANGDYKTSRQFTFELTEIVSDDEEAVTKELTDTSAKEMAEIMRQRLVQSGVEDYSISYSGQDQVTVTFYAESDTRYQQIATYLSFSGSFALMNRNNDVVPGKDFINGAAYKTNVSLNTFPVVVLPVRTDDDKYQSLIEWARDNPVAGEEKDDGTQEEDTAPVYFVYNYTEGDTYESLEDKGEINSKIYLTFNALTDDTLYYDGNHNSFSQVCGFSDENENGLADPVEITAAFQRADFFVNLFNASALDYDVKLIKGLDEDTAVYVQAGIERILDNNSKMVWNSTITATVAAVVILSLLMVVFFRLGAISVMVTTIASGFLTFLAMIAAGLQYNTLALVGIVVVSLLTLVSGIIYNTKLKEEAYKGRTLKKSNTEAAKKSVLPIVDIHVVTILVGIMLYFLGGNPVHTFASLLILGSLISTLISIFALRGMMWLVTNTTALTNKYNLFGIDAEKVPNHMADEKQKFYGPYAENDFTKKKKPMGIAVGATLLAGLIALVTLGAVNGNVLRQNSAAVTGSEIYVVNTMKVVTESDTAVFDRTELNKALQNMKVFYDIDEFDQDFWAETDTHKTMFELVKDVKEFVISDSRYDKEEEKSVNYQLTYFQLSLNKYLDAATTYIKVKNDTVITKEECSIEKVFPVYFKDVKPEYDLTNEKSTISLKTITAVPNAPTPAWDKLALATFLATLIITVYMLIRYRLSRGLAMLLYPLGVSIISMALISILSAIGLTLSASTMILIPVGAIITYMLMISFANKERELIVDDRSKDTSIEHREELSKKALGIGFTAVSVISIVAVYLFVNFFGFGPSVNSFIYLACIIAAVVALWLVLYTFMPLSNLLLKLFSKVNFEFKPRKKKKANITKKSAEPEEAIFIGIND